MVHVEAAVVIDESRVYSPAEIKAQGITLKVNPLANNLSHLITSPPEEASIFISDRFKEFAQLKLSDDLETLKAKVEQGGDCIFLKDVFEPRNVQLVSPPSSQIKIYVWFFDQSFVLRDEQGVKLWSMLEKLHEVLVPFCARRDFRIVLTHDPA